LTINIAIVDDKFINRKAIRDKLSKSKSINIVSDFNNGLDFYNFLSNPQNNEIVDVVVLDLDMPKMNGIDTIAKCKIVYPNIKYIILTIFEDIDKIFEAICIGANGYLLKEDSGLNIEEAIVNAHQFNGMPMSPTIARKAMELLKASTFAMPNSNLKQSLITERELEILKLLTSGASYPKIGEILFISPLTVRKHVSNIYEKLHVNSRSQLILKALEEKWI